MVTMSCLRIFDILKNKKVLPLFTLGNGYSFQAQNYAHFNTFKMPLYYPK